MEERDRDRTEIRAGVPPQGAVRAPGSKSHAIRALVCAALARGESRIAFLPDAQDVVHTVGALRALGVRIDDHGPDVRVHGADGAPPLPAARLGVGGSATALRTLAAVCALGAGPYEISGDLSLDGRPLGAVGPALESLGITVAVGPRGGTPVTVSGGPPRGGEVAVDGSRSSHPVTALALVAPVLPRGLRIRVAGPVVSRPYIELTREVLAQFGARSAWEQDDLVVAPGGLVATDLEVEGDWSSAAFLLACGPVGGGRVTVSGLAPRSAQADRAILGLLARFGAQVEEGPASATVSGRISRPVDVDLSNSPDLAPLTGALACIAPGTTRVTGARHLRSKETDRIAAVVAAARALGCPARELPDGFEVDGGGARGAEVDPLGDHRLAMAFAVAGRGIPGTRILDPGCVGKSFPGFWEAFARLHGEEVRPSRDPGRHP